MKSVTIGNSVTSIGDYAFYGCDGLTSLKIPNSVTNIGYSSYSNCSGLKRVTIGNSVTSIGNYAFNDCDGLETINFNATNCSEMGSYSDFVFEGCSNLTYLNIGENVTNIPPYAFRKCTGLKTVTIPNNVERIGDAAFAGCSGLTTVNYNAINCTTMGKEYLVFGSCTSLNTLNIGEKVTNIPVYAFQKLTGLTEVKIPNSVKNIDDYSFLGCSNLNTLTIGHSVDTIGSGVFSGCANLATVNYNATNCRYMNYSTFKNCTNFRTLNIGENVTNIPSNAFYDCTGLTCVTLPNSVTNIGYSAFEGCSGLTSVTIPNSVTSIGSYAFADCDGLTSIVVESENTVYDSRDNCNAIIETATNSLIRGCRTSIIPNTVASIGNNAFYDCTNLTSITLPGSVTNIGDSAFSGCIGLKNITIPNSVTRIERSAFSGCTGLTSVTFPNSVTYIGMWAFRGCTGLTEVISRNISPANINSISFDSVPTTTVLYVPKGSKDSYASAYGWNHFTNIIEDNTIASANCLTLSHTQTNAYKNKKTTLLVSLENEDELTAFECDLILPAGVTCEKVTLTDRKADHAITKSKPSADGTVKIAAISFTSSPFNRKSGALFEIELLCGEEAAGKVSEIALKNIKFSTTETEEYNLSDTYTTLNVIDYLLGDANGDGNVTITDAVAIVNYMLGNEVKGFVFVAADVSGNDEVTITDAVGAINLLLTQNISSSEAINSTETKNLSSISPKAVIAAEGNSLYMQDFTVTPDAEKTIYLYLDNTTEYCAFSADIHLPEGISIKNKNLSTGRVVDHIMSSSSPAENVTRIAALSFTSTPFGGNSGDPIVELTLSVDKSFEGGVITINNVELSTVAMDYCRPNETTANITLDKSTGINDILQDEPEPVEYYNLQGVRVENPEKGVFIKRQGGNAMKVVM